MQLSYVFTLVVKSVRQILYSIFARVNDCTTHHRHECITEEYYNFNYKNEQHAE